jgi:hypothetical protein
VKNVRTFFTPTASSSAVGARHDAYTTSPRAVSCLQSSKPRPAFAPVTTTLSGIAGRGGGGDGRGDGAWITLTADRV